MPDCGDEFSRLLDFIEKFAPELANDLATCHTDKTRPPSIPDYSFERVIGEGGFGTVWLARNLHDHQYYALKVLGDRRDIDLDGIREFKRRLVNQQHLVPIGHVGSADGTYFYVMPLADNLLPTSTLQDPNSYEPHTLENHVLRLGRLSPKSASRLAVEVLLGLEELHSNGGVHRDVKPANILRIHDAWKLGDPGLFAAANGRSPDAGTTRYRADWESDDYRRDLFALGVTLEEVIDDSQCAPSCRLRDIIARAKASDSGKRFRSAKEMRLAIEARGRLKTIATLVGLALASVVFAFALVKPTEKEPLKADIRIALDGSQAVLGPLLCHMKSCLLYTSPSPRDATLSRMPSSA